MVRAIDEESPGVPLHNGNTQRGDLIDVQRHSDKNSENRGKRILHVYRIKIYQNKV